jgi:uncharacterized protein YeaO (DUF488 family)
MPHNIKIKRAYEASEGADGARVLVDRLWPRGLTKERLKIDLWLRGIAPSTELRKWFGHDPTKWEEFQKRYLQELQNNPEPVHALAELLHQGTVTLVYGAKDEQNNEAAVLQENEALFLERVQSEKSRSQ